MENILEKLKIKNIRDLRLIGGGDVSSAYKIYTDDNTYFLLVRENSKESFYDGEICGLKLFEKLDIPAPRVVDNGFSQTDAYLLLTFLNEGRIPSYKELAEVVAKIHKYKNPEGKFGFSYPYEGRAICFTNEWTDSWSDLFINQRMDKLRGELVEKELWKDDLARKYQEVKNIMIKELDKHKSDPSLLHGDLWGGNHMFLEDGSPVVFDPSPLYGDREFDIGISTCFGQFPDEFYQKYQEIYPLESGYELRIEFYRLYLFMVHQLKFGDAYEDAVIDTIDNILKQVN